jgi:histidinol-phosphate aminotransferase
VGLLDYYRQFEELDPEEVNRELRARRAREKAQALEQVPELDLSSTEWPSLPDAEIVNAAIAVARGRVNAYPDRYATRVRRLLAERHGVAPEQVVVGNGAAELLQAAAFALLSAGDELVTPWPSYPLYPLMASRAGARPVAVDLAGGRVDPEAIRAAVGERTRVVVICNPNDPTGTWLPSQRLGELLAALPEQVHVLLDEAYVDFVDAEDRDACLRLVGAFPRLLVFRTFSKAWGLSGLRAGYAVGSAQATRVLEAIAPVLGVNALTQAAIEQALRIGERQVERRRATVAAERRRLLTALHDLRVDAPETQASFAWLRAPALTGAQLAARLEQEKVIVAPGGPLGDNDHVRVAIRDARATDRLLAALRNALA